MSVVLGSGEHRYRVVENWAKLPDGWDLRDVAAVGVDSKDATGDARSFMRRYGITYPIVHDGGGDLWGPYGVTGVPETRLISRRGKFVEQYGGAVKAADLRAGIEQALRT